MQKFKIPNQSSTTSKTIRFPNDLIEKVNKMIIGKNCTFSAFVIEAVRVILESYDKERNDAFIFLGISGVNDSSVQGGGWRAVF